MGSDQGERCRELAEAAWRWVLDHVAWDDGPWVPECVADEGSWREAGLPRWRDGMHNGIGGLAHTLAEVRLVRAWTPEEGALAEAIADRLTRRIPTCTDATFFDGLASDIGVFVALGHADRGSPACERLMALAQPDGWPQSTLGPDRVTPDARVNDVTLGTAGVLLGALWARRHGVAGARRVADHAATVLMAEAEPLPTGTSWSFVPRRFRSRPAAELPNWSHGLTGIAAALAVAGAELQRPDLTAGAAAGAEHLVTLADRRDGRFLVPMLVPTPDTDEAPVAYGWCHGPTGSSLLFLALAHAGIGDIAGEPPMAWHRRCLHTVATSGIPQRRYPGFWDNDGRCCGTAGVGEVFLDSWCRSGHQPDLDFAVRLADALVDHAVVVRPTPPTTETTTAATTNATTTNATTTAATTTAAATTAAATTAASPWAYWRFTEHRNADPLLPPEVGWMQGAAGIAAYLFRMSRVLRPDPDTRAVARMDTWWALPERA
ncbi:MAG: lanthionine synthetase LanC family protein [Dermatophilaceae bacterium]